ncbi:hypothetical protein KP509_12G095800 [Ceratopteris richardii]|uniref:Inositol polyphosphate-related phosphatase domain-containing protein n=1 Tax=Ceratopteris richardii TaxID=49495 RepID=A0A8T2TS29_CERRI|nr:hypothetical protein KP509_12G095800 [Ceratopteris richardii]
MTIDESRKYKFWRNISFRRWINRKHENQEYQTDLVDEEKTELAEIQDLWDFEYERRFSCSATETMLPRSFSSGVQPRHSSAVLLPRDSEALKLKFSEVHHLRVFVGTWNVGGRSPNDGMDIGAWLGTLKEPADVYVVGFQEVVPLNAGNVLVSENSVAVLRWQNLIRNTLESVSGVDASFMRSCSTPSSVWQDAIVDFTDSYHHDCGPVTRGTPILSPTLNSRSLGHRSLQCRSRYAMVVSKQMVGLFLSVWVRSELILNVRNVKVACIGCGLMGYLGNKGSISVSMCIHQTTFCFVCSHLASGQKDGDEVKRNADVADILRRTQFRRSQDMNGAGLPETIMEHDRVIWLGDLNYRLTLSPRLTRYLLAREDWGSLLEKDQLHIQRRAGRVFKGWNEGKIYFAPTYKYRANSDTYALENVRFGVKKRTPAWCDRILWYGHGLKQLEYVRAETKLSDHRPVYAVFSAEVDVLSRKKLKDFLVCKPAKVEVEELLSSDDRRMLWSRPDYFAKKLDVYLSS